MNLLRDEKIKNILDQNQLLSRSKQTGGRTLLSWSQIFSSAEISFRKVDEIDEDHTEGLSLHVELCDLNNSNVCELID